MEKTEQIFAISTSSIGYYIVKFLIMFDIIWVRWFWFGFRVVHSYW